MSKILEAEHHIYVPLSHLTGRVGHQKRPTVSIEYRFNQNMLRVRQKAVLLQTCHTVLKFLRHDP